jgi:hypothetical protein
MQQFMQQKVVINTLSILSSRQILKIDFTTLFHIINLHKDG